MANSRGRGRGANSRSGHPGRRPQQRAAAQPHSKPVAADPNRPDPYGPGLSGWMAKKTGFLLYWLSQRPKWFLPIFVVLLLLGGLIWHPWGAIFMFTLTALLAWLTILSWPVLRTGGRIVRILLILAVFGYGVYEVAYYLTH